MDNTLFHRQPTRFDLYELTGETLAMAINYKNTGTASGEALAALGQTSPCVIVTQQTAALPRAYVEWPMLFYWPNEKDDPQPERMFLYCPRDYKGRAFQPRDAFNHGRIENQKIIDHLRLQNCTAIRIGDSARPCRRGVAMPADFAEGRHHVETEFSPFTDEERRRVADAVGAIGPSILQSGCVPFVSDRIAILTDLDSDEQGRPVIVMSVADPDTGIWQELQSTAGITAAHMHREWYRVAFAPRTEQGKAVQAALDSVAPTASAAELWRRADHRDRDHGIEPPPTPPALWQDVLTGAWAWPRAAGYAPVRLPATDDGAADSPTTMPESAIAASRLAVWWKQYQQQKGSEPDHCEWRPSRKRKDPQP